MRLITVKQPQRILCLCGLLISLTTVTGCSFFSTEKIPITTTSAAALEHYLKGRDFAEKIRFAEAAVEFDLALAEDSSFALAHLQKAFVQTNNAAFFKSFSAAREQIDYVSKGERFWILAVEAGINSNPTKQRGLLEKLVSHYPKDERAYNNLAGYYFGQQLYHMAIEEYTHAIELNPEFSAPYNQLGYAYRFLGRYDDAREIFVKYVELIPDDPNPYDSYAELLLKMGVFEESIESYKKALAIDSGFMPSYVGVATNLMLQGMHSKAREEISGILRHAPSYGNRRQMYFISALTYLDQQKPKLAMKQLEQSRVLADSAEDAAGVATSFILQGYILIEEGEHDKARENFERSLIRVTKSSLSKQFRANAKRAFLFNAALADIAAGELSSARSYAAKYHNQVEILQSLTLTRTVHQLNGMIALAQGDYAATVKELEQANQQNPYNLYRLASAYLRMGDSTSARKLASEAAHFNQISSMPYALVRGKAVRLNDDLTSK